MINLYALSCLTTLLIYSSPALSGKIDKLNNPCQSIKENAIVIDKDICPREACKLGKWMAQEKIPVFSQPDNRKKSIFSLAKDEKFDALYGENHVFPTKIEVTESPPNNNVYDLPTKLTLKKGDYFYLITYAGEGIFRACFKSSLFSVDADGIGNIDDCSSPGRIKAWSRSVKSGCPKETWWVKIRTTKSKNGWIEGLKYKIWGSSTYDQ